MTRQRRNLIFASIFLVVLAGLHLACGPEREIPSDEAASPAEAVKGPYKLTIFFDGLIGFVQDKDGRENDRAWALLVDADYPLKRIDNKLSNLDADEVPHCVKEEAKKRSKPWEHLKGSYPPHEARIRIHNAKVTKSRKPVLNEHSLRNEDVVISTGSKGNLTVQGFHQMASYEEVEAARSSNVKSFDKLRAHLLAEDWYRVPRGIITSRVLISSANLGGSATIQANPVQCKSSKRRFGFEDPSGKCEQANSPPRLTEEVVFTQERVLGSTSILLSGEKLSVSPENDAEEVIIEVLNIDKRYYRRRDKTNLGNPDQRGCTPGNPHFRSYRWLYRLSDEEPAENCPQHYFPCLANGGDLGGRKCPQMLFSTKKHQR